MESQDVPMLQEYVTTYLADGWTTWPGGRPGEAEAALIDAVMSIRARYGQSGREEDGVVFAPTGVHKVVERYRALRGPDALDDLRVLAGTEQSELQKVTGDQKTAGRLKAEAIIEAADRLVGVGVVCADDLKPGDPAQKRAYTSVHGLGWVTWEYFGMLLGVPGVKADRWVIQAVNTAVGRPVSPSTARDVVVATADEMETNPTHLEHALWAYERAKSSGS